MTPPPGPRDRAPTNPGHPRPGQQQVQGWVNEERTPVTDLAEAIAEGVGRASQHPTASPVTNWRGAPLTIGLAVAILGAGGAVWGFALRSQGEVKAVAAETVAAHTAADVDRAHVDLRTRYTTRVEHAELVVRLSAIEALLQEVRTGLKEIAAAEKKARPR